MLPAASEALKVTNVSPNGKTASPSLLTETEPSTLSTAVAAAKNVAIGFVSSVDSTFQLPNVITVSRAAALL